MESAAPLEVTLRVVDGVATLAGRRTTAEEAETLAVHERVMACVKNRPGITGNAVVKELRLNRQQVYAETIDLNRAGPWNAEALQDLVMVMARGLGAVSGTFPTAVLKSTDGARIAVVVAGGVSITDVLDIPKSAIASPAFWYSVADDLTGGALLFPVFKKLTAREPDVWQQHAFSIVGGRQLVTKQVTRDEQGRIDVIVEDHECVIGPSR